MIKLKYSILIIYSNFKYIKIKVLRLKMAKNEILTDEIKISEEPQKENPHSNFPWNDWIPSIIYGSIMLTQIVLVFFYYNYYNIGFLIWISLGFIILFVVIGSLPRIAFKKYGGIEKGKSHINTTMLVDKGIYAIIRHPYWLCWIMLSISLTLLSQHWIMILLALMVCPIIYFETFYLDKGLLKKFGEEYREYAKRVPRMNLIIGLIKFLKAKSN